MSDENTHHRTATTDGSPRVGSEPSAADGARGLPALRIGFAGGLVGILCCVGPTMLALVGVMGASTAYLWANELYDGYAWWFRFAGLAVTAGLVWWSLRRRDACSIAGVRAIRGKLALLAAVGVATYVALYAATELLGRLAVG